MSQFPRLGAPNVAALFGNGRSPACWQRQVSHSAKRQAALALACGWVGDMVQQPSPALKIGPLLGGCLAELVAPTAGDESPPTTTTEADRPRDAHPATQAARLATKKQTFVPPPRRAAATLPLYQPAKARPDLLRRWAGETAVKPSHPLSANRRAQPARANTSAGLPAHGQKLPAFSRNHMLPGDPQNAPVWADQMVKRTREQFAPEATAVAQPTAMSPTGRFKGHRPGDALVIEKPAAGLGVQWQQSLTGPSAPLALLERLQAHMLSATDATIAPKSSQPSGAAPANRPAGRTIGAFDALAQGQANTAQPPLPPHDNRERPSLATANRDGTAVSETTPPHPDDADDGWYAAPRFAPPQIAEVLPRLRPLPKPGAPNLSPIAATVAERSARHEAESAPEDLDALSRQIKQILDEESRRHGIDV